MRRSLRQARCVVVSTFLALAASQITQAAVVEFQFGSVLTPPSSAMTGSAPWLKVSIQDSATPGTVTMTVSAFLTGVQTLTGLWLSTSAAPSVSSVSLANVTGTGRSPQPFATINVAPTNTQSGFDTLQDQHPAGTTQAQSGNYNLLLRFPNNAPGFQGNQSETFDLVTNSTSLTAGSFLLHAAQTAGGAPNPSPYAVASFTNSGGVAASGTAYVAGDVSSVPLPPALLLMVGGIGVLARVARGRKAVNSSTPR